VSFQVILEADNRGFVACGPISPEDEAAILPDYIVQVIDDDATQAWLDEQVQWPPFAVLNPDDQTFALVSDWPVG